MKTKFIYIVMALGVFSTIPAFAGQINHGVHNVDSRPCAKQAESLQEKIQRLEAEIKNCENLLSKAELAKLEDELSEAKRSLWLLNKK